MSAQAFSCVSWRARGSAPGFLWLAVELKVSASTQNQALAALLFLYRVVL